MQQKFCITPLTGAAKILHHTTNWNCRNSASRHWLVLQKFCITPLPGTTEILHPTTDWYCRHSALQHWLVLQKFGITPLMVLQKLCVTPLTRGAEILHHTTDWYCRNSASRHWAVLKKYPLVLPSNKSRSATTIDSFTVWFNGKDIQIVTKVYSNEGKVLITVTKKWLFWSLGIDLFTVKFTYGWA